MDAGNRINHQRDLPRCGPRDDKPVVRFHFTRGQAETFAYVENGQDPALDIYDAQNYFRAPWAKA